MYSPLDILTFSSVRVQCFLLKIADPSPAGCLSMGDTHRLHVQTLIALSELSDCLNYTALTRTSIFLPR